MLLPRSIVANVVTDAGDGEGGVPLYPLEAAEGPLDSVASVEKKVIHRVDSSSDGDKQAYLVRNLLRFAWWSAHGGAQFDRQAPQNLPSIRFATKTSHPYGQQRC